MNTSIPTVLHPLFWSYDVSKLDPAKHRKTVIVQVINYGRLSDWRWLREHYGFETVRETLAGITATEFRPQARNLAQLLFDVDRFNYAPRGTH